MAVRELALVLAFVPPHRPSHRVRRQHRLHLGLPRCRAHPLDGCSRTSTRSWGAVLAGWRCCAAAARRPLRWGGVRPPGAATTWARVRGRSRRRTRSSSGVSTSCSNRQDEPLALAHQLGAVDARSCALRSPTSAHALCAAARPDLAHLLFPSPRRLLGSARARPAAQPAARALHPGARAGDRRGGLTGARRRGSTGHGLVRELLAASGGTPTVGPRQLALGSTDGAGRPPSGAARAAERADAEARAGEARRL